jgi:hypothetical protein
MAGLVTAVVLISLVFVIGVGFGILIITGFNAYRNGHGPGPRGGGRGPRGWVK